jgi:hypothetical protein
MFDGFVIAGPLMSVAYGWLEKRFSVAAVDYGDGSSASERKMKAVAALKMMLVSCLVVDTFFIMEMMVLTYVTEGFPLSRLLLHLKTDLPSTLYAGMVATVVMSPLDFTVFRIVPYEFRQVVMNCIDLVWTGVVSWRMHRNRGIVGGIVGGLVGG